MFSVNPESNSFGNQACLYKYTIACKSSWFFLEALVHGSVKDGCENKFERPKIPKQLILLEDFSKSMTVTGKIQKFKLKEMACDLMGKN